MPSLDLESEAHDFPEAVAPRVFYCVASNPRSGSTLLERALWRTGAMGAPEEYFNFESTMWRLQLRLRQPSIGAYVDRVIRLRTGPNGVFGFKLHWPHWHAFWYCGRYTRFRPLHWIRIRRTDRLAQAVSLAMARQTGAWTAERAATAEPRYDRALIARALRDIDEGERGWDGLLPRIGAKPFEIAYEDLARDPDAAVSAVAAHLGVALDPALRARVALPQLQRQSDDRKGEWMDRFRAEARAAAAAAKPAANPSAAKPGAQAAAKPAGGA